MDLPFCGRSKLVVRKYLFNVIVTYEAQISSLLLYLVFDTYLYQCVIPIQHPYYILCFEHYKYSRVHVHIISDDLCVNVIAS